MRTGLLRFGILIGLLIAASMFISTLIAGDPPDYGMMEVIGYASFILAMLIIIIGIRSYRDGTLKGRITFGQAFRFGLGVSFVAGLVVGLYTFAHIAWIDPGFEDNYSKWRIEQLESEGVTGDALKTEIDQIYEEQEMVGGPVMQGVVMAGTILIIGVVISLLSAAILRTREDENPGYSSVEPERA